MSILQEKQSDEKAFVITTDYLQPAFCWLVYTYSHDIDIHIFLLRLSFRSFLLCFHYTDRVVVRYILWIYSLGLITSTCINGYSSYFSDLQTCIILTLNNTITKKQVLNAKRCRPTNFSLENLCSIYLNRILAYPLLYLNKSHR